MGYSEQYINAQDQTFMGKVCIAILRYAAVVRDELDTTPGHKRRVILAERVANSPVEMASKMVYIISSDPTAVGASDITIDSLVSSIWNVVAGIDLT